MVCFVIDPTFVNLLKYLFNRPISDGLCDVYDAELYKEYAAYFKNPYNLSLMMNYDGAPKFKSSNMQIWPVQLKINELPPILR